MLLCWCVLTFLKEGKALLVCGLAQSIKGDLAMNCCLLYFFFDAPSGVLGSGSRGTNVHLVMVAL